MTDPTPGPALVIVDHEALAAVAGVIADRCLFFAKLVEANAAIDASLYPYMADLARGAQHLIDGLPDGSELSVRVARLENALDIPGNQAMAA